MPANDDKPNTFMPGVLTLPNAMTQFSDIICGIVGHVCFWDTVYAKCAKFHSTRFTFVEMAPIMCIWEIFAFKWGVPLFNALFLGVL